MPRARFRVEGTVQGVGFRPFVYALARRLELTGRVYNDSHGVLIEAQGARLAELEPLLCSQAPALASVRAVTRLADLEEISDEQTFSIAISENGTAATDVSPDVATCDDCLRELFDPHDRRYGYPFINCSHCGPRYSILRSIPYDRANTTMSAFALCDACRREYDDPSDRRFHAQPLACAACGPRLALVPPVQGDPIEAAVAALRAGRIVAVKGLGGYHLAVDAGNAEAVARLRERKRREARPFALMVESLEAARALAEIDSEEERLLLSRERPIVLLRRRDHLPDALAPGQRCLGIMLPYTPLHHLLLRAFAGPLGLTSGNLSNEPIAHLDSDALERLRDVADLWLTHDRAIQVPTDDSVVRVPQVLRRSRGFVPRGLPLGAGPPVLAVGAELKSTVCVTRGDQAFLSQHLGDLENLEVYRAFQGAIEHLQSLLGVRPALVAHDLHPEYLSTRWALASGLQSVAVQHHHAHVAACMAEHGETGPVCGVAFDGTGYGPDATLWGGEFLRCGPSMFRRLGSLSLVALPGGAAAIRQPWRMVAAYLGNEFPSLPVAARHEHWDRVVRLTASAISTSSAGRLFDAIAALLDLGDAVSYEGEAAIALEQIADPSERGSYPVRFADDHGEFRAQAGDLVRCAAEDALAARPPAVVSARFHNALADVVVEGCQRAALPTVALTGGVFQNTLLLERCVERLSAAGFRVLTHRLVPCNDGGISYGQAAVASAIATP